MCLNLKQQGIPCIVPKDVVFLPKYAWCVPRFIHFGKCKESEIEGCTIFLQESPKRKWVAYAARTHRSGCERHLPHASSVGMRGVVQGCVESRSLFLIEEIEDTKSPMAGHRGSTLRAHMGEDICEGTFQFRARVRRTSSFDGLLSIS